MISDADITQESLVTCLSSRGSSSIAYLHSKGLLTIADLVLMPRAQFQHIIDGCPNTVMKEWCAWVRNVAIDSVQRKVVDMRPHEISEPISVVAELSAVATDLLSLRLDGSQPLSPITSPNASTIPIGLLYGYVQQRAKLMRAYRSLHIAFSQDRGVVAAAPSLHLLQQQCADLQLHNQLGAAPLLMCVPGCEVPHSVRAVGNTAVHGISSQDVERMLNEHGTSLLKVEFETDSIWTTRITCKDYCNSFGSAKYGPMCETVETLHKAGLIASFMWLCDRTTHRITLLLTYTKASHYDECCNHIMRCSRHIVADIALQLAQAERKPVDDMADEYERPFDPPYRSTAVQLLEQLHQTEVLRDIGADYNLVGIFPWVTNNQLTLLIVRQYVGYDVVQQHELPHLNALVGRYGCVEMEASAEPFGKPTHRQVQHRQLLGGLSIGSTLDTHDPEGIQTTRGTLGFCVTPNFGVTAAHCLHNVVVHPAVEDLQNMMGYGHATKYTTEKGAPFLIGRTMGSRNRVAVAVPRTGTSGAADAVDVSVDVGVFVIADDRVPNTFHTICIEAAESDEPACGAVDLTSLYTWEETLQQLSVPGLVYNLCGATTHSTAMFRCATAGVVKACSEEPKASTALSEVATKVPGFMVDYHSELEHVTLVNQLLMDGNDEGACAKGDSGGLFYADLPDGQSGLAVGMLHIGLTKKQCNSARFAVASPIAAVMIAVQQIIADTKPQPVAPALEEPPACQTDLGVHEKPPAGQAFKT